MNTATKIDYLKRTIAKIEACTNNEQLKAIETVVNSTTIWDEGSKAVINARIADVRIFFSLQNIK
jgi:hypothetical protein